MENNPILIERERRQKMVIKYAESNAVATIKANIPGVNKNPPESSLLVSHFLTKSEPLGAELRAVKGSADGVCAFCFVDNAEKFKSLAIELEQTHPLGRFIDIDVVAKGATRSLTRDKMRKCLLCDRPAFVCGKERRHAVKELTDYIRTNTDNYFLRLVEKIILESMMTELLLENKFGLVSPVTSGSHRDLNFDIMKKAAEAISPKLAEMFMIGAAAESPEGMLFHLRPIGLECERLMYSATGGANAYKGFIFVGGILLAAIGYAIKSGVGYDKMFDISAIIASDMDSCKAQDTFGYNAYQNMGFGGIRAHAKSGFSVVKDIEQNLGSYSDNEELLSVLTTIVGKIDDSVLLKRAGSMERYFRFKELISTLDTKDKTALDELNWLCVKENISIGGSADVLIAAVMIRKIKENFIFYEREN